MPAAPAPLPRATRAIQTALDLAIGLGIALVVLRLGREALEGVLASDECFHAYAAEWIARHRAIPEIFPELYSGLFYYYPPLLHLIGAAWIAVAGAGSLLALPVALHALMLGTLAFGALGAVPRRAGLWAAALLAIHPGIAAMAVRLYAEPLVTLLFVLGAALLFRARAATRFGAPVALGIVAGLALLAKFNAWSLWLGIVAIAAYDLVRGRRASAARLGLAAAIALAMVAPWLVRNAGLFGSAFYPAFVARADAALDALNRHRFSTPPGQFLSALPGAIGSWIVGLSVAALAIAAVRREWRLRESVLAGALLTMVVTAFVPYAQARHLNPPLAVAALMACGSVSEALAGETRVRLGIAVALAALLGWAILLAPNPRPAADPPAFLSAAMPQVAKRTPPDARILSLWTYDTWYATRRAATWPIPWGQQDPPVEMFYDREPDSVLVDLRRARISHLLTPARLPAGRFDSANYPEAFMRCVAELLRTRRLGLLWRSPDLLLLVVRPPAPADSAWMPIVVDSTRVAAP